LALLLFFHATLAFGEPRSVRVGLFPAEPLVGERNGKPAGLFIDLVDYFAARLDWRVEYVRGTWEESLARLEGGAIDLMPAVSYTQARSRIYDFSKNAVYIDSGVLFTSPKFALHTIFDLQDRRVAALRGSLFTKAFEDYVAAFGVHCEILLTADNEAVMRAIVGGDADAGVCIYSLGNELAKRYPVEITPISFAPTALEFATFKGRNADLIAGVDRLMAPMVGDPASFYSQVYRKWALPAPAFALPPWLAWGLGGLLVLGLILGSYALLLRRQVKQRTRHLVVEIAERRSSEERLTQSLREKETLLKELYHRTKNTMQVVRSLIALQAVEYPDNREVQALANTTNERIQSIALVHEMLYKSQDLSRISVKEYIERMGSLLFVGASSQERGRIELETAIEDMTILLDMAMPLGLILNELMTNSIRHGFPDGRTGKVRISLVRKDEGKLVLQYSDDGVGVPASFDFQNTTSFGLNLIRSVGEQQMMGRVRFFCEGGVHCVLEIPTDLYNPRI
jgi:two-component sensor histidine kinase/ABC-type amino acid transport substrate-binding protein